MLCHNRLATWCLICIRARRTYNKSEQEYYRRSIISPSSMWTRRCITPTNHCLSFLVNNMPAQSTHRTPLESRRKKPRGRTQRGGTMLLCSGIKTGSNWVEKRLSKLKSHLPFLCACFKGHGKQRCDMITAANRGQIESISEIALNLLKGNILIPKSSFERLRANVH